MVIIRGTLGIDVGWRQHWRKTWVSIELSCNGGRPDGSPIIRGGCARPTCWKQRGQPHGHTWTTGSCQKRFSSGEAGIVPVSRDYACTASSGTANSLASCDSDHARNSAKIIPSLPFLSLSGWCTIRCMRPLRVARGAKAASRNFWAPFVAFLDCRGNVAAL